ncbi:MAG: ABC transporter substrate-binding protein [Candidatus Zixiibacteriota bacterium]
MALICWSVRRYLTTTLFLLLALTATGTCVEWPTGRALQSRDAGLRAQFDRAVAAFADSDYVVAESLFVQMDRRPDAPVSDHQVFRFMQGRCLFVRGDYSACARSFIAYMEAFPASEYASAAQVFIGHCWFLSGDPLRAARAYARALAGGPEAHRRIALDNLVPLIQQGLPLSSLAALADALGDDRWSSQARYEIAERWAQSHRRIEALREYKRVTLGDASTDLKKTAEARIRALAEATSGPTLIGLLVPLTGGYADYGQRARAAAWAAIEMAASPPRLVIIDTGDDPLCTAGGADSLIRAGCTAVIGPLVPEDIAASVGVLRTHPMLQILPVVRTGQAELSELSPWIIQFSVAVDEKATRLVGAAVDGLGLRRLALLAADSKEGREAVAACVEAGRDHGATICATEYFSIGAGDIHSSVSRLARSVLATTAAAGGEFPSSSTASKDQSLPVDGLVIWGADPEDLSRLVPLVRAAGFRCFLLGDRNWEDREMLASAGAPPDSVLFVSDQAIDASGSQWADFARTYRRFSPDSPDWFAARVYDAVAWIAAAGDDDADALIDRLIAHGLHGVAGVCAFNVHRIASCAQVYRYTAGGLERVAPTNSTTPKLD